MKKDHRLRANTTNTFEQNFSHFSIARVSVFQIAAMPEICRSKVPEHIQLYNDHDGIIRLDGYFNLPAYLI